MFPKIQLGLRKLLLIVLACAAWFAYLGNEHRRSRSSASLILTLKETRSLDVQDTSKVTASSTSGGGHFGGSKGIAAYHSFQCFVPSGDWEICLATRGLTAKGFPSGFKAAPLRMGTSEIELTVATAQDGYDIVVLIEGSATFVEHEDETWCNMPQLLFDGNHNPRIQTDNISPIELTRMRFGLRESLSKGKPLPDLPSSTNGVLIWLRRIGED